MKVKLDGARIPTRAHETDAGLDLYSRDKVIIFPNESYIFDTGVHIELPKNSKKRTSLCCVLSEWIGGKPKNIAYGCSWSVCSVSGELQSAAVG